MSNVLYNIVDIEAKSAKPSTLRQIVKELLKQNDMACYEEMEVYLTPRGVAGSRSFDQAYAVSILLKHDADSKGQIATSMVNTPALNHRALWDILVTVLRDIGLKVRHGRIVGTLEFKSDDENGDGEPDVD